jgi:hypothetical protein
MKEWQFNVLFFIAAGGAVVLMFSPKLHLEVSPTSLTGYGMILTFVLTQKKNIVNSDKDKKDDEEV